ncbi:MAG: amidase [Alphaproteobacteria bacterium]|nr:amidase [Alphaproteobacteria bacterium]
MADLDDVLRLDATEQAALVRRGEVGAAALVEAAIGRIEALNPKLNAIVTPLFEQARGAAETIDPAAPFAGVPFLIKDLVAEIEGTPLAEGSRFLAGHYRSDQDSELVARFKRAGLVILGRTNTPEFGLMPTTEPELSGPCRNPWDLDRTTGGSSGGSAAAVAAGIVAMAHANDGGGSIRVPASCCGLFGLKPTRARNPLGPGYGDMASGLIAEHVVTHSVRDSAGLLDLTSAPDPGAPYPAPAPARPFADEVGRDPGCLKIAFSNRPLTGAPADADCTAAVEDAARLAQDLGHEVEEAAPALDGEAVVKNFARVWIGFVGWAIRDWQRRMGREPEEGHFEAATWTSFQRAEAMTPADYLLAVQDLQAEARAVARFFEDYDLWLTPTLAEPPCPLGAFVFSAETRRQYFDLLGRFTGFTLLANVTGQPAMSVPLHWNAAGLPIGVHFFGSYGGEATLFRLAAQLEAARPWADRRPPAA